MLEISMDVMFDSLQIFWSIGALVPTVMCGSSRVPIKKSQVNKSSFQSCNPHNFLYVFEESTDLSQPEGNTRSSVGKIKNQTWSMTQIAGGVQETVGVWSLHNS